MLTARNARQRADQVGKTPRCAPRRQRSDGRRANGLGLAGNRGCQHWRKWAQKCPPRERRAKALRALALSAEASLLGNPHGNVVVTLFRLILGRIAVFILLCWNVGHVGQLGNASV